MNDNRTFRIGELANELGINPKTIRYYEAIGLLPEPARSAAGYRLYRHADRERLQFILKAKAIGFTLDEVGEVAGLACHGEQPCDHVLTLIDRKLAAVDDQIRALLEFRQELEAVREGTGDERKIDARFCSIIEHHHPTIDETHAASPDP